ncbi:ribbon-helix-helix domain-containing protein [Bradyrhizobium sp. SZCCHNR1093]|uniref:ribbon-helix-helix domain-containing protein n=1 Tax=Bradyrhizobium sp. SZCCHNR1093 TaxID=3057368 RepID=UPI0028E6EC81|nr:ribbon-helix-helix domain-containing protein [Bradyrhizobium sp. SZCCHNR1093]
MAKKPRFPIKLEFWTSPEQYEALQLLADASLMDRSDHLRQAVHAYLANHGAIAAVRQQQTNGAAHHTSTESA